MKKKLIALSLGFTFLIAGFGVSYDFEYGVFDISANEVKAETAKPLFECIWWLNDCYLMTPDTPSHRCLFACEEDPIIVTP